MDNYLRHFNTYEIDTLVAENIDQLLKVCGGNKTTVQFKMFHTNICSIQKNFTELEAVISQIGEDFFDIIVLSETWGIGNLSLFNFNCYTKIYSQGNLNKSDGVVVYVKQKLFSIHYRTHSRY